MCGIAGVCFSPSNIELFCRILPEIKHRGLESFGVGQKILKKETFGPDNQYKKNRIKIFKYLDAISADKIIRLHKELTADPKQITLCVYGQSRYPTKGPPKEDNTQPIRVPSRLGSMTLAGNGDAPETEELLELADQRSILLHSQTDSAGILGVIMHQILDKGLNVKKALAVAMNQIEVAYSSTFVAELDDYVYLIRDRCSIRPLYWGRLPDGGFAFCSETCGLKRIGIKNIEEVKSGEILIMGPNGYLENFQAVDESKCCNQFCLFEGIWLMKPTSEIYFNGKWHSCSMLRQKMAKRAALLAKNKGYNFNFLTFVSRSGQAGHDGVIEAFPGVPQASIIIANDTVSRTFLQGSADLRKILLDNKFDLVEDKALEVAENYEIVAVTDDSLISGLTTRKIVSLLRSVGIKNIHFIIHSPPYRYPCVYGIDTNENKDLIASKMNPFTEIAKFVDADYIHWLPNIEELYKAILGEDNYTEGKNIFCDACFTGRYPTKLPEKFKEAFCRRHGISNNYFEQVGT